jgi:hypothetical protein
MFLVLEARSSSGGCFNGGASWIWSLKANGERSKIGT